MSCRTVSGIRTCSNLTVFYQVDQSCLSSNHTTQVVCSSCTWFVDFELRTCTVITYTTNLKENTPNILINNLFFFVFLVCVSSDKFILWWKTFHHHLVFYHQLVFHHQLNRWTSLFSYKAADQESRDLRS